MAGAAYLDRAREILASVDSAADEARRVAEGLVGRLRIGCVGSATYTCSPPSRAGSERTCPAST